MTDDPKRFDVSDEVLAAYAEQGHTSLSACMARELRRRRDEDAVRDAALRVALVLTREGVCVLLTEAEKQDFTDAVEALGRANDALETQRKTNRDGFDPFNGRNWLRGW
jgi:hypothetical protein